MKNVIKPLVVILLIGFTSCENAKVEKNIKMYSSTWDEIINQGNLDLINNSNFDENVTMVSSPEDVVGIDNFKAYYSNFVTGFSNIEFTIVDVFGQGDKLVKHWRFKGTHSGDFFGMPATNNNVDVEGVTLVEMKNGKIAKEQDFMDNMVFLQQLGIASSANNVSVIQGIYNSFGTGDIDSVVATFDPNILWMEAENFPYADGNPYKSADAIVSGVFARVGSEWDNFHIADLKLHDMSNNMVLATGRYQGIYKKNGVALDAQVAHLWTLNNGKVVGFQQYTDTKGVAKTISK